MSTSSHPSDSGTLRLGPGGRFQLDIQRRRLLDGGVPLKLGSRAFDLLVLLVRERGRTVPKAELLDRLWPDVVVAEHNLEVHVWALRKLLGAQAVVTVPGRGYGFAEEVVSPDAPPSPAEAAAAPTALLPRGPQRHERLQPLIGRAEALADLGRRLDAHRLVSVVGAGGIGKTLLVQHALATRGGLHPHGVCFVDLGGLDRSERVAPAVATALGIELRGDTAATGPAGPGDALAAAMAPLSLLVALDNADHLRTDVALVVKALLDRAHGVRLVVTSQTPLQLSSEEVMRLEPLSVPEQPATPDEARRHGAPALFELRAQAADHRFVITDANVDTVCALCRNLDGSPLALELAAARVPLLGVERLAASLGERLALLTKQRRDAPARQRSLRAALEWTHGLLSEDERTLFRQLAVVHGSASLELVQAVAGGIDVEDAQGAAAPDRLRLLDALDGLIERSLVVTTNDEPPRYRLLDSPLALAREHLASSGEAHELQARHARAVSEAAAALDLRFEAGIIGHDVLLESLDADVDNLRAALRFGLLYDARGAVMLARPMSRLLTRTGYAECRALWAATERCLGPEIEPALRGRWLIGAASFSSVGALSAAESHAQAAVDLLRKLGDARGEVQALAILASLRVEGDTERRAAALERIRGLVQADWPPAVQSAVCKAECLQAYWRRDWDQADVWMRRWLVHSEAVGSRIARNAVAINLVGLTLARGRAPEAVTLAQAPLTRLRGSREPYALLVLTGNLSAALLACERVQEARVVMAEGWALALLFQVQAHWFDFFSLLAALEARPAAAAALCGRADAAYQARGERRDENQQRANERARALALAALGEEAYAQAAAGGECLSDSAAAAIAFATEP